MTVVAFDLNGLKEANDRLGHAEGDRLIISASSPTRTHFNTLHGSLAARFGGDELVVSRTRSQASSRWRPRRRSSIPLSLICRLVPVLPAGLRPWVEPGDNWAVWSYLPTDWRARINGKPSP
jgi:hypothetical protein